MEFINNGSLDSCLIIANKLEIHRDLIELLYESKKRTGGGDIKHMIYDQFLKQYIVFFECSKTVDDVINFGDTQFSNELYQAFKIDKTRIILEDCDFDLKKDVLNLYIDYLFEDIPNCEFKFEILKPGSLFITCNYEIDFDLLKKRHMRHNKLQNKLVKIHLVPLIGKDFHKLEQADIFKYFVNILNNLEQSCLRDDSKVSRNSIETNTNNENFYKNTIKNLERKLRLYENLNENLSSINQLSEHVIKLNSSEINMHSGQRIINSVILSNSDNENPCSNLKENSRLNSKEDTIICQYDPKKLDKLVSFESFDFQPDNSKSNRIRLKENYQKYLIDESRNIDEPQLNQNQTDTRQKSLPKSQKSKNRSSTNSQCIFMPFSRAKSIQNLSQINKFPIIKYQRPRSDDMINAEIDTGENFNILEISLNQQNTKCSICLEDLIQNEDVRILSCFHQFHVKCIDTWLAQKITCPTCKLDLTHFFSDN